MKKFVLLDSTPIPDERIDLCLFEYGDDFIIKREDGKGGQLMNTRMHGSEDALGRLPCAEIAGRTDARVLIGGLGMGFTLAAALAELDAQAQVLVAELLEGVIRWNQGPLGAKAGYPTRDPRAQVLHEDVARILKTDTQKFDAILLDVDNGPEGLTQSVNSWLYSTDGLQGCKRALRPGGVLAVWSASIDQRFSARLRSAGFRVNEVQVFAHGNRGPKHTIWFAR